MNIGERVKYIRKELADMTQDEFSKKINISRSNLGGIETNRVNMTDRVAKDICKEFKINYLWLLEEKGEIKTHTPDDLFDDIKKEFNLDNRDIELLKEYASLDKEQRVSLQAYIIALINVKKTEDN